MSRSDELLSFFNDRYDEVLEYLELIDSIDISVQNANPIIGGDAGYRIKPDQQKILYSCVYLQLYNLVEATITKCIEYVTLSSIEDRVHLSGLNEKLKKMWVKYAAKTHTDAAPDTRLINALRMCQTIITGDPISDFQILKGGGGNWCDVKIYNIAQDIGLRLNITRNTNRGVKAPRRNGWGALELVMRLRNELAHGSNTFVSCGDGSTARDMRELSEVVATYLREVINNFINFIAQRQHLEPHVAN